MIIPVRCFTCGKVLGDKWEDYKKLKIKYLDIDIHSRSTQKNYKQIS